MRRSLPHFFGSMTAIDAAGIGLTVVLTLALLFGALTPVNARVKQLSAARQTAARESQRHAGLITAGRMLQNEIEKDRQEIAAAPMKISSEGALNQRLADLAQLSNECRLTVDNLKPDEAIPTVHFLIVPVQMSGRGSYQSCAMFIHALHQQLPDVDVRSFKLAGIPNDPASMGRFEFQLGWYALPRGTAPPTLNTLTAALAQ
jgi:Tfp pilus assembly protein PilO